MKELTLRFTSKEAKAVFIAAQTKPSGLFRSSKKMRWAYETAIAKLRLALAQAKIGE